MNSVQVAGREYPLELTVQAFAGISELCPEQDFARFGELLNAPAGRRMMNVAAMACVLSEAAEAKFAFEQPAYEPTPLTLTALLQLPFPVFREMQGVVLDVIYKGLATKTVELDDTKKANAENGSR